MQYKTESNNFVNSCLASIFLGLLLCTAALSVYFFLPHNKTSEIIPSEEIIEIAETQVIPEEEDLISEAFQEYLAEVSFEKINSSTDAGLTLYRQSISRSSVEWFYTHITGNRDIALAITSEADRNDIPLSLAFALAFVESRYNAKAVNSNSNNTTDRGLFQLNSNSFPTLSEADFFDPYVSSKYGMSHLKFCLNSAGNEVSGLAMYNAGTNRVRSNKTPQTTLNYIGKIMTYQNMLDELFREEVVSYYEAQLMPGYIIAIADKH